MADAKTSKPKVQRNLGPRFMHLVYNINDNKLTDVAVVSNMESLVEAIQAGKSYSKVQLPARKAREAKAA